MTHLLAAASLLAPFFPAITRWATGDRSEKILPQVLDIASQLTGSKSPHKIAQNLLEDPEILTQFQKRLIELEKGILLEEAKDRHRARTRDIALIHAGRQNFHADIMVIAAALGLAACLLILAFYRENLPGEAVGIISTVAGIFGSCLKDAYAFEFGSSRGSKDKDQHVSAMLKFGK